MQHCLHQLVLPVLTVLMDLLLVPYFMARVGCMFVHDYQTRTVMVRFSYHLYLLLRLAGHLSLQLIRYLSALHQDVRDSRYLIGTQLTNRS